MLELIVWLLVCLIVLWILLWFIIPILYILWEIFIETCDRKYINFPNKFGEWASKYTDMLIHAQTYTTNQIITRARATYTHTYPISFNL